MIVQFVAKRSLVRGRIEGEICVALFDVSDANRSRYVDADSIRAMSGRTETLRHAAETRWAIEFAPVGGTDKDDVSEFLDSTASGEEFDVWLYGDEASPIRAYRADSGYDWKPFIRKGSLNGDLFTAGITIAEIE